jgi:hypothetical protein
MQLKTRPFNVYCSQLSKNRCTLTVNRFFTTLVWNQWWMKTLFLMQQYRLFSNYSSSLQINMSYSDYTRVINTINWYRMLLFVKIRYVGDTPNPYPDWYYCRNWFCRSYRKWITVGSIRFKLQYLGGFCQGFHLSPPPYWIFLGFVSVISF